MATDFNGENPHSLVLEKEDRITNLDHAGTSEQAQATDQTEERFFSPEDEATLTRIASELSVSNPHQKAFTRQKSLTRIDTIAEISPDDPVMDPKNEKFDLNKWVRFMIRAAKEENVKFRRTGLVIKNLSVSGSGAALNIQKTVASTLLAPLQLAEKFHKKPNKTILSQFDSVLKSGEMLIVLGRPGSGCSTYLKSICGETRGLTLAPETVIHYNGIPQHDMMKHYKGEVVYNQEVDKHFPHLTVGQTLEFAAAVRTPQNRLLGLSRAAHAKQMAAVTMAIFGLSHTYNTKVGNDFIRGVSGGERKRVSIAEMSLGGSPVCCWDNSTRGLDASTAFEFVKSLRLSAKFVGMCHAVAIYQASQAIYDQFDKAIVLYEGREIFYGPTVAAKQYFEEMGWHCPQRQTTGDFLTSVTNPVERRPRVGFENRVPRTPKDFEDYWRSSPYFKALHVEIEQHEMEYPIGGSAMDEFRESRKDMQADHVRPGSPFTISVAMQIGLCTRRAYQRLWNDRVSTFTTVIGQIVMSLIIGSIFYGTPASTAGFFAKGAVIFFAILLAALISITEINTLYDQRPIVEKQASYAFYHPFTEALAGTVSDIPIKFLTGLCFNIILYFLSNLRREPAQFFIFLLFSFITTLTMSAIFRTIAASTKTISQALAIAGVMVLAISIYTGFTLPIAYMHPWFRWIQYINPVGYAFEAMLTNELHGRNFTCSEIVPANPDLTGDAFICGVAGAVAGQTTVSGDAFLLAAYSYRYTHIWRNLGIAAGFFVFFTFLYLLSTELNSGTSSTAEVLVFRKGHVPKQFQNAEKLEDDEESQKNESRAVNDSSEGNDVNVIPPQKDIFTWRDVTYDIQIKGEPRRLLDHVSGWVKPGTLTALMGVSGAGKTTLLDVLAQRTSIGVIHGDMLVNGKPLDSSFQRKTGYVQQQDLHLETSTVREALRFSAMLRQPKTVSKAEKYAFVEDVIKMLNMFDFAEAVVGVPGEGLNVEQRKLLTIGVELAAKPALLLFLDEPTSGLDSQSSWAIIAFLRKLADHGQAVLSTIHQPSSILFQEFDRLLFLAKGGKTVYFGDIGKSSRTLLDYFENHGGRECGDSENPAEYMLEIVGAGAAGKSTQDWSTVWNESDEAKLVQKELDHIHSDTRQIDGQTSHKDTQAEFAMPFSTQLQYTTIRVFQQYWRTPTYIYGKFILGVVSALFIGFSFFQSDSSQQGLQNLLFSLFMITSIFSSLVQQIMPRFVTQRALYEVRERPSKAYSWVAFLTANIIVEIPYQVLLGVLVFASFYYPVFGIESSERQGLIMLFCIQFFVFTSTFAHMVIAALPDAETAGNIATLMFALTLVFNGVMQTPSNLPGFWIFMYRVSPLTYLVEGMASTGMHGRAIICSAAELSVFNPPAGQSCGTYMAEYLTVAPGSLSNPSATTNCEYCSLSNADQFLEGVSMSWDHRWRDFGLIWVYISFNIVAAVALYYLFRVKKWKSSGKKDWAEAGGKLVQKLFLRRPGESNKGRESRNDRLI